MNTAFRLISVLVILSIVSACRPIRRYPDSGPLTPVPRAAEQVDFAPGWRSGGTNPELYNFALDSIVVHSGAAAGTIQAMPANDGNNGSSITQAIKADAYRGQRVRLSGYLKTESVTSLAALWMNVEGADGLMAAFDNMWPDRAISGTTDWQLYEIVLDVPDDARRISFGVNLGGKGQVWFDDLQVEAVGEDVPMTKENISAEMKKDEVERWGMQPAQWEARQQSILEWLPSAPSQPTNLDFEQ